MTGFTLVRAAIASISAIWAVSLAYAAAPLETSIPKGENVEAQLVAETKAIVPGETFFAALHFKIRDDWHTYWRFAGDSGAPTTIDWKLPPGFAASDIVWPTPIEIPLGPLMDYGYEHEVLHLVSITAPAELAPGGSIALRASAEWLVCSDEVCIPEWADLSLTLPVAAAGESVRRDPVWGDRIAAAVAALPVAAPFKVSVRIAGTALQLDMHDPSLARDLKSGSVRDITYFPYTDGIIRHPEPQELSASRDGVRLTAEASYLATSDRLPEPLAGLLVVRRADSKRQGYEISAGPAPPLEGLMPLAMAQTGSASGGTSSIGAAGAVLFAFIGGLILNLMPCVFPVLSMKALAFARHRNGDRRALRRQGWAFTAGVMLSFLALALALFGLRESGNAIGWGFQLQSPVVVLLLAYLMFAIGLSLSGALNVGAGLAGIGDSLARRPGFSGSFFTGVLATVVATPCTGPFMGAALGYAMLAPTVLGLCVFLALGFGLALPFLALSHAPRSLAWLPKPGPWMERLKELLAFPMYGAAVWLVWVLAQQSGADGLLAALGGFVLIGFAAWLLRLSGGRRALLIGRVSALVAILSAAGLATLAGQTSASPPAAGAPDQGAWIAYSPERLDAALTAGRPAFVDATAAWCLTCKVNELGALSSRRVLAAFRSQDVLLLRADWTNRDAAITELLSRHGRVGVPLYLYYAKDSEGNAQILPQILTEDIVLKSLKG